jgi:hypothetical protein
MAFPGFKDNFNEPTEPVYIQNHRTTQFFSREIGNKNDPAR